MSSSTVQSTGKPKTARPSPEVAPVGAIELPADAVFRKAVYGIRTQRLTIGARESCRENIGGRPHEDRDGSLAGAADGALAPVEIITAHRGQPT